MESLLLLPRIITRKHLSSSILNTIYGLIFLTIFLFSNTIIYNAELIIYSRLVDYFRDLNIWQIIRLRIWWLRAIFKASCKRVSLWFKRRWRILFIIDNFADDESIWKLLGLVNKYNRCCCYLFLYWFIIFH